MATWVRSGTGTSPSSLDVDAPLTGTVALDNATAPGDFDPAGVTAVRIQYSFRIAGTLDDDVWDDHGSADLSTGGGDAANIALGANTRTATGDYAHDGTDNTPNTGLTTGNWEGAVLDTGNTPDPGWADIAKSKGWDGSTGSIPVSLVTVTITYTPTSFDLTTSGIINGGGSLTAALSTARSIATAGITGGGSLTSAQSSPSVSTVVELKLDSGSAPYLTGRDILWVRHKVSSASLSNATAHYRLYDGTSPIGAAYTDTAIGTSVQESTWYLVFGEPTSYSDLRVRIWLTDPDGDIGDLTVYDIALITPEATAQPQASGTINGGGELTATVIGGRSIAGAVNGGGSLTATTIHLEQGSTSGTISGGGNINATTIHLEQGSTSGAINGGGSLTATTIHLEQGSTSGLINGGGSLTAAVIHLEQSSTSGVINGGGSLTAAVIAHRTAAGAVNGGGSLTGAATGTEARTTSGTITGGGSLTATTIHLEQHTTSGAIEGGGGLTATVIHLEQGSASGTINGGGDLTAIVVGGRQLAGAVNGGGSITSIVIHHNTRAGTVSGGGNINATVIHREGGTTAGILSGGGGLTAIVVGQRQISAAINGGGSLTTAFIAGRLASGTVEGGGSITATTIHLEQGSASGVVSGGGSLTASYEHQGTAAVAVNGGGGLFGAAIEHEDVAAVITGGGGLTATTIHLEQGATSGVINGGGSLTAAADKHSSTSGVINGGGSIAATTIHLEQGSTSGTVSGGGSLAALVEGHRFLAVGITGGGGLAATVIHVESGAAQGIISGGGGLSATADNHAGTVAALVNGGGSLTSVVAGHHVVRAFPDLPEGLMGPGVTGGGGLTATVNADAPVLVAASISGGGSIGSCVPINKAGITATAYRTKWGAPEYTINGNIVEATDNRHRNETTPTTWIQWDLGAAYRLTKYDFYNMASPWGVNGSSAMVLSNVPRIDATPVAPDERVVDLWTTYGTHIFDQPFLLHGTTTPVTEAFRYVRMPSANWGMVEITFYACDNVTGHHVSAGVVNGGGNINATVIHHEAGTAGGIVSGGGGLTATAVKLGGEASGTVSTGGSVDGTIIGHHVVRAFPDLGEGLFGPSMVSGGGGLFGEARQFSPGQVGGTINTGGGLTTATTGYHVVAVSISGGGGLTANEFTAIVAATISGGGGLTADGSFVVRYKPGGSAKPRGIAGRAKGRANAGSAKTGLRPGKAKPGSGPGTVKG